MSQKYITIEERKLKYICDLLKENYKSLGQIDDHFKKVDEKMSQVHVGSNIYDSNCWGDIFKLEITKIIDKDYGTIEVIDHSLDEDCKYRNVINKPKIVNISYYEVDLDKETKRF